jgi:hypothetical protein
MKKLEDNRPMPSAVFLNSDGVDDSFPIEDNMGHMAKKFYYPVLRMFIEDDADLARGWEASLKELAEYLPNLSKRGSGDDISVAGIIDMDAVKAERFSGALQKAKTEAEERRARENEEREKAVKAAEEARAKAAEEKKAEPTVRPKPADDPLVQEKALELKRKQEEIKKCARELVEAVEAFKKNTGETDADIPSIEKTNPLPERNAEISKNAIAG